MASAEPVTVQVAPDRPRSSREIYAVMSGLMIAMLLAMLDNLIVGTALPTIVGELGGLGHLSWVVTAYALATGVSTPVWAKLGDLFGRKGVFMASIVVFLVGSALSGLGVSLLGAVFAQRLERGMDGQVGAGQLTGGAQVTPAMLGQLPAAVREAYQQAITSGVHQVFLWGAAIAVVAVVAAWFIHEVPLRGTSTERALEA